MIKKSIIAGVLGVYSLCAFIPFSAVSSSALSPVIDSGNKVCYNFGDSNIQCVSSLFGNSICSGVFGVLPYDPASGSRHVFHSLHTDTGAGATGLIILEDSDSNIPYSLKFGSYTYTEIQIYVNGYFPARYFNRLIDYTIGAADSPSSVVYDCYFAYTVGNSSSLSIYNPEPVDLGDSVVDNFKFDYPVQFDSLADNSIVYVQGWHNFKFDSSSFTLLCESTPFYEDWGYIDTLVGSQLNKPLKLDILGSIISSINSFLNIDIFPGFSFKSLMYLVFAVTFFGFILRTWLGG